MSLAEMRAYARAHDLPVEIERATVAGVGELVRIWSLVGGERLMADELVPADRVDPALDELAARFLFWWRQGSQKSSFRPEGLF